MKTFELELPDDIADQLDETARSLDTTPEDLARMGIEEKLNALMDELRMLSSYLYVVDHGAVLYRPPV